MCNRYHFFFSNRIRLMILVSDWSSDVCSSDLIAQHGNAGRQKPRGLFRHRADKCEDSPEKDQHAEGNRDALCRRKAHGLREPEQHYVKQNIVPLPGDIEPRRLLFLAQLHEPCVVDVAPQVARFNPPVPEARDQHRCAQGENQPPATPQEGHRRVFFVQEACPGLKDILQRPHSTPCPGICIHSSRGPFYPNGLFLRRISAGNAVVPRSNSRSPGANSDLGPAKSRQVALLGGMVYFEAWFSPSRFRRSRKRRCSCSGVLGLKATRYHNGWLRSRLSHASVFASAFGWRATFSRIAP